MGHLTPHTSPSMQRHLIPEYETSASLYQNEFDIQCPELPQKELNAKSAGCLTRLTSNDIPKSCRVCEQGQKMLTTADPDLLASILRCHCGAKVAKNDTKCSACRQKTTKQEKARVRDRPGKKICTICNETRIFGNAKYCAECRPLIADALKERRKIRRKKQQLLKKQEEIANQLKDID